MADTATEMKRRILLQMMQERGIGQPVQQAMAPRPTYGPRRPALEDIAQGPPLPPAQPTVQPPAYLQPLTAGQVVAPAATDPLTVWDNWSMSKYDNTKPEGTPPEPTIWDGGPATTRANPMDAWVEQMKASAGEQPTAPAVPPSNAMEPIGRYDIGDDFAMEQRALNRSDVEAYDNANKAVAERKSNILDVMQGFGKGLGHIASGVTTGPEIMAGTYRPQPREDEVSEQERAWYLEQGIPLPPRMKRSELAASMPSMTRLMATQESGGRLAEILARQDERIEQGRERLGLQKEQFGVSKGRFERIPTTEMKDMQARMDTIRVFEDLARNKEAFAKHLGPIKGRLNWLERKVGLDNSEASTLRGDIGVVVNLFSKESTGQARGMPELGWIKEQMPAATDKPETFEAFIDRWIARLKEQYNRRKKSLALRNFDVEPIEDFPEIGGSAETQAVAPGKALYTVTGDTGEPEEQELSPEDIEKLKQYDPSLRFERH